MPNETSDPQDIDFEDGKIYVLDSGTLKYYFFNGFVWDVGIALPAGATSPKAIDVKNAGNLVSVLNGDGKIFTRRNNAWDNGTDGPTSMRNFTGFSVSEVLL